MEDMVLRVKCPCCMLEDGEENTRDNLLLLGDDEQNMQWLGFGFGSNNKMKSDDYNAEEFQDVCKKILVSMPEKLFGNIFNLILTILAIRLLFEGVKQYINLI